MHLSNSLAASILATIQVLAFKVSASTFACKPVDGTYKATQSPNYLVCTQHETTATFTRFTCGDRGEIWYDFKDNELGIVSGEDTASNQLSFHGVCKQDGSQVAHVDMYTTATGERHVFPGFNRPCNLAGRPDRQVSFFAYTLNQAQINACAPNVIKPVIGG